MLAFKRSDWLSCLRFIQDCNSDFILIILKQLLAYTRPDLKLVLMSATVEVPFGPKVRRIRHAFNSDGEASVLRHKLKNIPIQIKGAHLMSFSMSPLKSALNEPNFNC